MRNKLLTALTVFSVAVSPTVAIAEPAITVKSVEDPKVVETIKSHIDTFRLPTKEEVAQKQIEENLKKIEEQKKAEAARIAALEAAKKAAKKVTPRVASVRNFVAPANTGNADAIAYGQSRNAQVFGEQHWSALFQLWSKESGWRDTALNRSSGACGIPQFINGCVLGDHVGQIEKGLVYIAKRYGNPTNAWNFWRTHHWY